MLARKTAPAGFWPYKIAVSIRVRKGSFQDLGLKPKSLPKPAWRVADMPLPAELTVISVQLLSPYDTAPKVLSLPPHLWPHCCRLSMLY